MEQTKAAIIKNVIDQITKEKFSVLQPYIQQLVADKIENSKPKTAVQTIRKLFKMGVDHVLYRVLEYINKPEIAQTVKDAVTPGQTVKGAVTSKQTVKDDSSALPECKPPLFTDGLVSTYMLTLRVITKFATGNYLQDIIIKEDNASDMSHIFKTNQTVYKDFLTTYSTTTYAEDMIGDDIDMQYSVCSAQNSKIHSEFQFNEKTIENNNIIPNHNENNTIIPERDQNNEIILNSSKKNETIPKNKKKLKNKEKKVKNKEKKIKRDEKIFFSNLTKNVKNQIRKTGNYSYYIHNKLNSKPRYQLYPKIEANDQDLRYYEENEDLMEHTLDFKKNEEKNKKDLKIEENEDS